MGGCGLRAVRSEFVVDPGDHGLGRQARADATGQFATTQPGPFSVSAYLPGHERLIAGVAVSSW